MYIPLSDDKHRKVRDSSKKRTGNPRQNSVQKNFSPMVGGKFFFGLNLSRITYRSCISYAIF